MGSLVLNLTKAGEKPGKLSLNLKKGEKFTVRLSWEGKTDIDLHALVCTNAGDGAKASSFDDVLSTYNVKRRVGGQEVGTLAKNADGTFSIHGGALKHSRDAEDGDTLDVDEWIEVLSDNLTPPSYGVLEIPLVAMIHPQSTGQMFRNVQNAAVSIENSLGVELLRVGLSDQFGGFVGVQMGSIMIDKDGANFVPVGVGFNGDFNSVLGHFS